MGASGKDADQQTAVGPGLIHVPPGCPLPVSALYADRSLLVASKPPGLLSVPGRVVKDCVLYRLESAFGPLTVVHRLDLDTSGLMVFARTPGAVSALNRAFRERLVAKTYTALAWGTLNSGGEITLPLARNPTGWPRQRVDPRFGKEARTQFEVSTSPGPVGSEPPVTRLTLRPLTGRSHQLRIHLAAIGHPILGCDLYAHADALAAAPRLLLHASELAFAHPESGAPLRFVHPPPF